MNAALPKHPNCRCTLWPPPLTDAKLEYLGDGDYATWEDSILLLPDRWVYRVKDVLSYVEAARFQDAMNSLYVSPEELYRALSGHRTDGAERVAGSEVRG